MAWKGSLSKTTIGETDIWKSIVQKDKLRLFLSCADSYFDVFFRNVLYWFINRSFRATSKTLCKIKISSFIVFFFTKSFRNALLLHLEF